MKTTHASTSTENKKGGSSSAKLQKLFEDGIKDIYWAEKALTKAIPKMIKNATNKELAEGLEHHLKETENHVKRLEDVFEILDKAPQAKKCDAMDGLIKEADELMKENAGGSMRDAAIILAGQKVEHYEIATYGTLKAFAEILGLDDCVPLLEQTLEEEKAADEKLTEVTPSAVSVEEDEEQ